MLPSRNSSLRGDSLAGASSFSFRSQLDTVAGIGWCAEEGMTDPKLIQSPLSRIIREDGTEVRIDIYRLETTDWSLEVVDETGASTVWDDLLSYRSGSTRRGAENDPRRRDQDISEGQNRHYALTV